MSCSTVDLCLSILLSEMYLRLDILSAPWSRFGGGACHPMEVMHDSPWCHLAPTQVNGSPNAIIMTLWTALDYQDSLTSQSDTVSRLLANQLRMLQVGLGASHCYGELPSTLGFQAPMWHLYAPCEAFTGRISAL